MTDNNGNPIVQDIPWMEESAPPARRSALLENIIASPERFIALTPFIYLGLGILFGWWAWAWMIIPVSAILLMGGLKGGMLIVALSPFIYLAAGFMFGGVFWQWGWMIIPISGILFGMDGKSGKKAKYAPDETAKLFHQNPQSNNK